MLLNLYYFHDPMCSWCWAFRPLWQDIMTGIPDGVSSQRILGGLAPDTDQIMTADMQAKLKNVWLKIQQTVPGTPFNFEFWEKSTPRRSTYAACRAVIAARQQNPDKEEIMIQAIQTAYYLQARNPADIRTLIDLANEIGLDSTLFSADLESPAVHAALIKEIAFTHQMAVKGFPSLLLGNEGKFTAIQIESLDSRIILQQIKQLVP
jgi:putative protein-disulfide isomerase